MKAIIVLIPNDLVNEEVVIDYIAGPIIRECGDNIQIVSLTPKEVASALMKATSTTIRTPKSCLEYLNKLNKLCAPTGSETEVQWKANFIRIVLEEPKSLNKSVLQEISVLDENIIPVKLRFVKSFITEVNKMFNFL